MDEIFGEHLESDADADDEDGIKIEEGVKQPQMAPPSIDKEAIKKAIKRQKQRQGAE